MSSPAPFVAASGEQGALKMSPDMGKPFDPGFNRSSAAAARRSCGGRSWRPLEIAAMVAGFALYWPLGLAVIAWKFWQKKSGYEGDLFSFTREKWEGASNWSFGACASQGGALPRAAGATPGLAPAATALSMNGARANSPASKRSAASSSPPSANSRSF
ncbi:protein of unknown function [Methylocella tundrae]|uniref:Uncharacterized protein n=1 Tax=Methylocella tundrae TaxID=227605 RepID=A0A4U8Z1D2_METTU|nr:protein of unknown function [Methylocella tundrae]